MMKSILGILIVTMVLLAGYMYVIQSTPAKDEADAAAPFPGVPILDRTGITEPEQPTLAPEPTPTILDSSPSFLSWQKDALKEMLTDIQPVPNDEGVNMYQLLETAEYSIQVTVTEESVYGIDIYLKSPTPLYTAREHAEQAFVALFKGERDDLCGFPIVVQPPKGHPLAEIGTVGLEQCGADKIPVGQ